MNNPQRSYLEWRRGRDSNPRFDFSKSGFQDRRNQPLCHPSRLICLSLIMAGREGLEPPTDGFGDRYSTN
jgi:hypothetical protein